MSTALFPPAPELVSVNGLPSPLTPLIGREAEVTTATSLLRDETARLLTLIGPGGVGKTRMAFAVAERVAADFAGGVVFVSLEPIRDTALVASAVARVLGVREMPGRSAVDGVKAALAQTRLLLLLDNFEQVIESAPLVADLLTACPAIKVLVTSRTVLRLTGEQVYSVPPLALPDFAGLLSVEQLRATEAVRLFVARAIAARPRFALTQENAGAVAGICHRLDGLPLAIELAASRVRMLPPAALLARLEPRLPLLTGGPRDLPARLQTMRDAIAWSYDLLTPAEQTLLRHLTVFVGGFTLDAAEAVANADGDLGGDVFDGLTSLTDQSLLRQVAPPDAEPRFGMLETIREFGLGRLLSGSDETTTRQRHAAYFTALAEVAAIEVEGPGEIVWNRRLDVEYGNLRAALSWALANDEGEISLRLAGALWRYWESRGHFNEGRRWLEQSLTMRADLPFSTFVDALCGAAIFAYQQGDFDRARLLGEELLTRSRESADPYGSFWALFHLATLSQAEGDDDEAVVLYSEALALAPKLRTPRVYAGYILDGLAGIAFGRGELELANNLYSEALAGYRAAGNGWGIGTSSTGLGNIAFAQGDLGRAAKLHGEALRMRWSRKDLSTLGDSLLRLAEVAVLSGQAEVATRLLATVDTLQDRIALAFERDKRAVFDRVAKAARRALGESVFLAAWETGQMLSLDEAINWAGSIAAGVLPQRRRGLQPTLDAHGLSARERDVLRLVAEGQTDQQIADALFIGRRTVTTHVSNILGKLGLDSRAAAAAYAVRHGLA